MRYLPPAQRDFRVARHTGQPAAALTAAVAGVLVLAACSGMGGGSAAAPRVSATITVAATPGVPDAPLYIGIRNGLFKAAGLTIRLAPAVAIKTELARVRAGSADIAFADYADVFYANVQRPSPDLKIVADGYDCGPNVMEVLTLPGSHITTPQDLANAKIGTPLPQEMTPSSSRPYSLETTATWAALNNDGVSPSGIRWDPMPAPSLDFALRTHQVDAILVTEPTITDAETALGAVPVLDSCSGPTANLPLEGYVTTAAFAKRNPAVVQAFRSALAKAQAQAATSAPVQTALEDYAKMSKQAAALVTVGTYPTTLAADNVERVASLMFFFNAFTTPVNVAQMIVR